MPYVRNAWYVAAWSHDVEDDKPFPITILSERVVIYRQSVTGILAALEDRCIHRLAPLSLGRCEGANLRCMYHGILFAPDGSVIEIPGQETIPESARVRSYPVVERHSWVWVWMGEAARADPELIPPAVGLDDPNHILGHGQLDCAAEASLIHDNQLDFSHLSFVHAPGSGPQWALTHPKITLLPRGVRIERWFPATPGFSDPTVLVDNWVSCDFLVPGVLLMWSGDYPAGTAEQLAPSTPSPDHAISGLNFTSQAVTPLADRAARHFFSWGPHRAHGDEALRDRMVQSAYRAFGQDKAMIEAQQRVIDDTPGHRIMPTAHDKGLTLFNRLRERLVREEMTLNNPADNDPNARAASMPNVGIAGRV